MLRTSLIAVALVALLSVAACGDEDGASGGPSTAAVAGDPERYCALTRELDADGEKFFSRLGQDAGPEEFEAAERRFIQTSQAKLDELGRVAPRQIEGDVRKLLDGMRRRAGLKPEEAVSESQASAAEKRIKAYEKRTCSG